MDELIWHVDENDQPIGSISRNESRKTGARYRIVRVLIRSSDGRILLQKRVSSKKTYPGCWDTTASGNIEYGESYVAAAKRELSEEAGIKVSKLTEVDYFYSEVIDPDGRKMNRFTKLFITPMPHNSKITPQESEVEYFSWKTKDELDEIINTNMATDGLLQVYRRYLS